MSKPAAVILLNYNTPDYTAACIRSLQQYCNADLFDVIVLDNGSADGSLAALQSQFPELIFIDNKENLGFAEGNNRGLRYSIENSYTYSLVINTDTLVDEDILSKLTAHLDAAPAVAAVQPAIYWMHNRAELWNGPGYFNSVIGKPVSVTRPTDQVKSVEWVTGCCMLIRNSALQKAGLFNKQFFLYYEDVELSFRLRENGFQLHYLPSCKMYHEAGASGVSATKQKEGFLNPVIHYYNARNRIWFLRRYGRGIFYPVNFVYNGFYYLSVLAYFIVKGKNKKSHALIRGVKEGLFTPKSLIWPPDNN